MYGWLSRDIETLEELQEKFCNDTECQECYFKNSKMCLSEAIFNIKLSYNHLELVFTNCINEIKEQF